jgi:hypothetical protein
LFSTLIAPTLEEVKAIFGVRISGLPMLILSDSPGIYRKMMDALIDMYQKNRRVFVPLIEKAIRQG